MVRRWPVMRMPRAASNTFLRSATPEKMARTLSEGEIPTLDRNPALLAKVLESQAKAIKSPQHLQHRLDQDPKGLARALRNCALQQVLQHEQTDFAFVHMHWQQCRKYYH